MQSTSSRTFRHKPIDNIRHDTQLSDAIAKYEAGDFSGSSSIIFSAAKRSPQANLYCALVRFAGVDCLKSPIEFRDWVERNKSHANASLHYCDISLSEFLDILHQCYEEGVQYAGLLLSIAAMYGYTAAIDNTQAIAILNSVRAEGEERAAYFQSLFTFKTTSLPPYNGHVTPSHQLIDRALAVLKSSTLRHSQEYLYHAGCISQLGQRHDYAFASFKTASEMGCPHAQRQLGLCYLSGLGTRANLTLAIEWLVRASDNLDAFATAHLAEIALCKPFTGTHDLQFKGLVERASNRGVSRAIALKAIKSPHALALSYFVELQRPSPAHPTNGSIEYLDELTEVAKLHYDSVCLSIEPDVQEALAGASRVALFNQLVKFGTGTKPTQRMDSLYYLHHCENTGLKPEHKLKTINRQFAMLSYAGIRLPTEFLYEKSFTQVLSAIKAIEKHLESPFGNLALLDQMPSDISFEQHIAQLGRHGILPTTNSTTDWVPSKAKHTLRVGASPWDLKQVLAIKNLAASSNPVAQFYLAVICESFLSDLEGGMANSPRRALSLYQSSANQGYLPAIGALARFYLQGVAVAPCVVTAFALQKVALAGPVEAMFDYQSSLTEEHRMTKASMTTAQVEDGNYLFASIMTTGKLVEMVQMWGYGTAQSNIQEDNSNVPK